MMKKTIALFGATGKVGSQLLQRLLNEGAFVNVLVRDASQFNSFHPNINVIEGDVLDYSEVEKCIQGTQLVYVCIGTWGNKITQVYSMGTENIIMAMIQHGVKRIICLSSAGIFGYDGGFFGRVIVPLTLWRPFRDKRKQAYLLASSDLEWTLVRATEIIKEKKKGNLRVSDKKMISPSISMGSLINFLVSEQLNQHNIGKMPIVGD